MTHVDRIIAIIRKHKEECEEAQAKYDNLPGTHHIPLQTVQRKQYAIDTQIMLLQSILDEIDKIVGEECKQQQVADALLQEEF